MRRSLHPNPELAAGSGEGDGPSVSGVPSVAGWTDALGVPAADEPVRASDVHGELAAAGCYSPGVVRDGTVRSASVEASGAVGTDANAGSERQRRGEVA